MTGVQTCALPIFVQVEPEGEFLPEPLQILEREEIELRNRTVVRVKVQWKHFTAEEATYEREAEIMEKYPFLFKRTLVVK